MKIVVLGSGSSGNATYIIGEDTKILIDAGISKRQIENRLAIVGIDSFEADAILITHEHCDHTGQLPGIIGKRDINYYVTEGTFYAFSPRIFNAVKDKMHTIISPLDAFMVGNIKVLPIMLSHDAVECIGYILEEKGKKIVYIADTGYVHSDYYEILRGADAYFIEANHDPFVLMNSNRPVMLKQRILGDNGHLSNQDSAATLCYLIDEKTKSIVFLHRSKECNDLNVLKETVKEVFEDFSMDINEFDIVYAEQDVPTKIIEV